MLSGSDMAGAVDLNKLQTLLIKLQTLLIKLIDMDMKERFDGLSNQITSVNEEIKSIKKDVDSLERSQKYLDEEIIALTEDTIPNLKDELKKKMDEEVKALKEDTVLKLKVELNKKIEALENARLEAELYSKKTNLLFFNIPEKPLEDAEKVILDILKKTNITDPDNIQFVNVHRLPTRAASSAPHPVIAKFVKMRDRDAVLHSVNRSNINLAGNKVFVAPHLPTSLQLERKKLVATRNQLKAEGKNAKIRVTGTKVQIFVDGQVWRK